MQTYTTPYTAQFHNPLSSDKQMAYNESGPRGPATVQAMTNINNKCPLTSYVLMGFSQGAVIAGDVASDIGNGRGPVDNDLVLGVTLIAMAVANRVWATTSGPTHRARAPRSPWPRCRCCRVSV